MDEILGVEAAITTIKESMVSQLMCSCTPEATG